MADKNKVADHQQDEHKRRQLEQTAVPTQAVEQVLDPGISTGPPLTADQATVQAQANTLSNPQAGLVQRQDIAKQIANTHGNQHLNRVVQRIQQNGKPGATNGTVATKQTTATKQVARSTEAQETAQADSEEGLAVGSSGSPAFSGETPPPPVDGENNTNGSSPAFEGYDQPYETYVQTQLSVNEPGDAYEQEADQVAEAVMRMPDESPKLDNTYTQSYSNYVQTQTEDEETDTPTADLEAEEDILRAIDNAHYAELRQPYAPDNTPLISAEISHIQTKGEGGTDVSPDVESKISQMQGGGSPLPDEERSFFESRMGADFSNVRVHTDSTAVQTSRDLNARAFTTGSDIAFNSGEYQPGTNEGRTLMAHELTHVVQQGGAEGLQRKADDKIVAREADESSGTSGPAPNEVIALDEEGTFTPSEAFGTYLEEQDKTDVQATLGNLARGKIPVEKQGEDYQTVGNQYYAIQLTHPTLARINETNTTPVLAVRISSNTIDGYITIGQVGEPVTDVSGLVNWIKDNPELMGWLGFDLSSFPNTVNQLQNGVLTLKVENFNFKLGGFLNGSGTFGLENETGTFEANANVKVEGLTDTQLQIEGDTEGNLKGEIEVPVNLDKFSGNLKAKYDKGVVDIEGKAGYDTEKLSGEVTLLVTDEATASNIATERLGPDKVVQSADTNSGADGSVAKDGPRAVAGWGKLTFQFTEWMAGEAEVIIDNKGQVTVVGEIAPPAEVEIFPQKDYTKELFELKAKAPYGVPLLGNVYVFVSAGIDAEASIGPAKIYNIAVKGTYSTDPNVLNDFSIEGTLNISAFAGLKLGVQGGAGVELLAHEVEAGVGINAMGGVKGYVEATPTIGYREQADPAEGKQGEFYIKGHMEIAAQPFIELGGELFVEVDSPWISPVGDHKWPWELGTLEYALPGEFGIGADVDYTIGSGEMPEIQFGEVDFNADKFMTEVLNDKVPPDVDQADVPGKWDENQTSGAGNVDPTITDSQGPPSEDEVATGNQDDAPGEVPDKSQEEAWQAGLKALIDLGEQSEEEPVTKAEIEEALKPHKFSDIKIKPTGDDWTVYIHMGNLNNEAKPAIVQGKNIEEEVKEGLTTLHNLESENTDEGGISEEEAQKIAEGTKEKHPVFESIKVVDGKDSWDYGYTIQREEKEEGEKPKENDFKATKVSNSQFTGNFGDFPDGVKSDYPSIDFTSHPANELFAGNEGSRNIPTGTYTVIIGLKSNGAQKFKNRWINHLEKKIQTKIEEIEKKNNMEELDVNDLTDIAEHKVFLDYQSKSEYTDLEEDDLYLPGTSGNRWQGHHIHPIHWSGEDEGKNIQFLIANEHQKFSNWWNNTEKLIWEQLG